MTVAQRKEREKAARYNAIIRVAERLFFTRGYEAITMDDIARESELSKGTLYTYFENKEDLYFSIVLHGVKIMNAMFKKAVKGKATGMARVYAIGVAFFEYYKKYPEHFKIFSYATSDRFEARQCESAREIDRISRDNLNILYDSIKAGIDDGTIRPDIDPLKTSIFLIESSYSMLQLPMGLNKALEGFGMSQDELVFYSLDLLKRSIENGLGE